MTMLDEIRRASAEDFEAVCAFYEEVCIANENEPYGPVWHYGIYPSPEDICGHLDRNELMIGLRSGHVCSAMVLTDREDPIYAHVPWNLPAEAEEVSVLHLFAVHPRYRGRGVSQEMMNAMFEYAGDAGKKRIHLDVVKGNLPAEKLYRKIGFCFVCEMEVFYEDTGNLTVELYEFDLTKRNRANA